MENKYDLVVVGAGIFGLQAVRTYLDIHPEAKVIALEGEDHVGGVWGKSRYYPGFWTQGGHGIVEFSDRRMDFPKDHRFHLFDSKYVVDYIEEYLDNHSYAGAPLRTRFKCNFFVSRVSKGNDGTWIIVGRPKRGDSSEEIIYHATKIMVASGTTSVPNIPTFEDIGFKSQIYHIVDFGRYSDSILSQPPKHISVLGAGKSAADMVYSAAKAGHTVSWIIRKSGSGPGLFVIPSKLGKFNNPTELVMTRFAGTLSPSHFVKDTWWMRFLHGTAIGRWLLLKVLDFAEEDSVKKAEFGTREGARAGFEKMKPDASAFWIDAAAGMVQMDDFWPTIADKVQVYRNDISHLSSNGIHLEAGPVVPCDVFLLGTGYKDEYPFFDAAEHIRLGLSHPPTTTAEQQEWTRLAEEADQEVIRKFPLLATSPGFQKSPKLTPFRLYNAVGPIYDHTVAFVGCVSLVNMFLGAEVQALWASAWLDGTLDLPSEEEMKKRTAMDNQWSRRRYPYYSATNGTVFDMECVPYCDRLLEEVGVSSHVKGLTWWQYWTNVNWQSAYKGCIGEYITKVKKDN